MEIKRCPFCGGEGEQNVFSYDAFYSEDGLDLNEYYISCKQCLIEPFWENTPEEAIKAWNKRAEDKE